MSNKNVLSWNDRFALIDHFKPSDEQIIAAFSVNKEELETARNLRTQGTFVANVQLDASKYTSLFASAGSTPAVAAPAGVAVKPAKTSKVKTGATIHTKPETATKKVAVKVPAKRGRKGDKISKALQSVTTTPVAVDSFIKQHGVSLAVLRQSKRFLDKMEPTVAKKIGKINVRQDKGSKQLMIWREDA